jgi:hypothetical protein
MILNVDVFRSCMVFGVVGKCNSALVVAVDDVLVADIVADFAEEPQEYQSMVGSLMYAMLATRPDLAQCIQQISQYSQKPTAIYQKAAKHALRYLKGTMDEGITFDGNLGMKLECWSDASWGGEEGRESVSGFVFTIAGGVVSYSSKFFSAYFHQV